jgi:hypothetical protein
MSKKTKPKFKIIEEKNENINIDEMQKIKQENQILIIEYINSLDDFEIQAMNIAKKMLESSFDIEKSIGFLDFKKNKNNNNL